MSDGKFAASIKSRFCSVFILYICLPLLLLPADVFSATTGTGQNLLSNPEMAASADMVEVTGSLEWPKVWKVFGPVERDDAVLGEDVLSTYPDKIEVSGKILSGKDVEVEDTIYTFPDILVKKPSGTAAYAFIAFTSSEEQEVTLGMGADWWMQAWVNGRLIYDSTETSNVYFPFSICNHLINTKVRKGENILAVRFIRGGGTVLALGGPDQLREAFKRKGRVPEGWKLRGKTVSGYDNREKAVIIQTELRYDGLTQTVNLSAGHYLLRALAKTNTYAAVLWVMATEASVYGSMPIGLSSDYRWAELPFCVPYNGNDEQFPVEAGIILSSPGSHYKGEIKIKGMELVRLGDTSLPADWPASIPVHPLHGLEAVNEDPNWERPGKVIFHDTFLGTELWLMTQGGKVILPYTGFPNFSSEGKYVHAGYLSPGHVLRTDGSFRYNPPASGAWRKQLWLFPWEEKRLPEGADPSDWIAPVRTGRHIEFFHLPEGTTHEFYFPVLPGWEIIHYPSISTHALRGPDIASINYETIVWRSADKKKIALSDIEGWNFRIFKIKSISAKPENDVIYPLEAPGEYEFYSQSLQEFREKRLPINFAWGKCGENWRNAVDKEGRRYFVFELNRDNYLDAGDTDNPYQVWMICLNEDDGRGLLRVVPNPMVEVIAPSIYEPRDEPMIWWDFAAGLPRSGDEAVLLLEDGTMVHMSSLGMHSEFGGTVKTQNPYTHEIKFVGSYPGMDHIHWPHEFKHDEGFAVIWAGLWGGGKGFQSLSDVMIDLKHKTLWTLVIKNYNDFSTRRKAGLPFVRHYPTPSPDFTKVVYGSTMLQENAKSRFGDAYIAVARYPQPPVNVRLNDGVLVWERPEYSREIKGFNIYRSKESGRGYEKINSLPVKETRYSFTEGKQGFYVLTSVEHSGLESRNFSNEVSVGESSMFRLFHQAEDGKFAGPMVPFFEPKGASNLYAVAVTDPELVYKKQLEEGLEGSVKVEIDIPVAGRCFIKGRVRGMSGLERSSYTTGWQPVGEPGKGAFRVKIRGRAIGGIPVEGFDWRWEPLDTLALVLPAGRIEIEFAASDAGIALDNILVTNDPDFEPGRNGNAPAEKPSVPSGVGIEELKAEGEPLGWRGYTVKPPYVKLSWQPSSAPQGIRYYNIYRSKEKDFQSSQAALIGSNTETCFIDPELEKGAEYYYKIEAVDNWDNRSQSSIALPVMLQ